MSYAFRYVTYYLCTFGPKTSPQYPVWPFPVKRIGLCRLMLCQCHLYLCFEYAIALSITDFNVKKFYILPTAAGARGGAVG